MAHRVIEAAKEKVRSGYEVLTQEVEPLDKLDAMKDTSAGSYIRKSAVGAS